MDSIVTLKDVLKQYRITHWVEDDRIYRQVTVSHTGEVRFRGEKRGREIGRKRQFMIDLYKHPNTLIFIRQGVFKGGIGIAPAEVNGCLVTENMPMFDIVGINPNYLSYYLKSPQFKNDINRLVPMGTAQKAIHERQLLELKIPLPSEEVQSKVTQKLDTIGKRKTQLSSNITESIELTSSLRQAVLKEAVSGKLVSQDPNDEPASELLKRISTEKEGLIKDRRIVREKQLPPISENKIPYEIPKGWVWTRLGEICYGITSGSTPHKNEFCQEPGIPFLKVYNIVNNKIDFQYKPQYIEETVHKTKNKRSILYPNDVIMNIVGPPLGKIAVVPNDYPEWNCNQAIVFFRPILEEIGRWIYTFLCEGSFLNSIELIGTAGQDNISVTKSKKIVIPLAPISEQKRIIQKVDQLMRLRDELEEKVKESQNNSELLMEAVLKEAFAS